MRNRVAGPNAIALGTYLPLETPEAWDQQFECLRRELQSASFRSAEARCARLQSGLARCHSHRPVTSARLRRAPGALCSVPGYGIAHQPSAAVLLVSHDVMLKPELRIKLE